VRISSMCWLVLLWLLSMHMRGERMKYHLSAEDELEISEENWRAFEVCGGKTCLCSDCKVRGVNEYAKKEE